MHMYVKIKKAFLLECKKGPEFTITIQNKKAEFLVEQCSHKAHTQGYNYTLSAPLLDFFILEAEFKGISEQEYNLLQIAFSISCSRLN